MRNGRLCLHDNMRRVRKREIGKRHPSHRIINGRLQPLPKNVKIAPAFVMTRRRARRKPAAKLIVMDPTSEVR